MEGVIELVRDGVEVCVPEDVRDGVPDGVIEDV